MPAFSTFDSDNVYHISDFRNFVGLQRIKIKKRPQSSISSDNIVKIINRSAFDNSSLICKLQSFAVLGLVVNSPL